MIGQGVSKSMQGGEGEVLMSKYVDYAIEELKCLTAIPSPTGYTKEAAAYVAERLEHWGAQVRYGNKGTVFADLGGEGDHLVLAAHIDTLGAMVRSVKENGRLRPTTLGGHNWATADGENCQVFTRGGKAYTGVVLNTEPSMHVADEKIDKEEKNMEILLDENVKSKEDTLALGIAPGDFISMDPRTVVTQSGYIKSRFLDDKLSTAILIALARYVKEEKISLKYHLTLMFTVYEEVGHGGCTIPEDTVEMISVDMGCVGADLECREDMVSICAKDSGGPYNYDVTSRLVELAGSHGINYAVDVYPHYGSDVEAALRSGYDIRHGLVGPGVYASHNYERSHVQGVKNTLELLAAYIAE